ncbi:MAG: DUF481 domain-containing protein [Nitrospiraceae bacterium]
MSTLMDPSGVLEAGPPPDALDRNEQLSSQEQRSPPQAASRICHLTAYRLNCTAVLLLAFLLTPATQLYANPAAGAESEPADVVTVHDTTLRGRVVRVGPDGIEFTTIYGKGNLSISYDAIERVVTQGSYRILYGDKDEEARGRLLGIEDAHLLVGADRNSAERIPVKDIVSGVSAQAYDESFMTRLRTNFRHWSGSLDLGLNFERGAVDKDKIAVGLDVERRKKPTRFALSFRYAFETEQKREGPEVTTKDELSAFLLGEYDLWGHWYLFGLPAVDRDVPRRINFRTYPSAGIGYRLIDTKTGLFQIQGGFGYVFEDFEIFGTNSYASGSLGAEGRYRFGHGIVLDGRLLYYPGIPNPRDEWLFRWEANLTIPLVDPLALRFRINQVNDNNPSPDVGSNKWTTTLGLAVRF